MATLASATIVGATLGWQARRHFARSQRDQEEEVVRPDPISPTPDRPPARESAREVVGTQPAASPPRGSVSSLGATPSYHYKYEEHQRRKVLLSEQHGVRHPVWDINDKLKAFVFADRHGIDRPQVFGIYPSISDVAWETLPAEFVLKPRTGSFNRGVLALRRLDDRYTDVMRSQEWTRNEILEHVRQLRERGLVDKRVFAEELVASPRSPDLISDDWKFYCFSGQVGLIMQRDLRRAAHDKRQWRFKFWGGDWRDLGPVKFPDRVDPTLPPPVDPPRLLAVAEHVAAIAGLSYIRVDLLESNRGPLLGEFTPNPGRPEAYTPELDERLGQMWEEAEASIAASDIVRGRWDHLRVREEELETLVRRH